jgi:hypothetical protein
MTLINTSFGLSQSNELQLSKHKAYLEIAGHGGMASINYETKIKKKSTKGQRVNLPLELVFRLCPVTKTAVLL